MRIFNRMSTAPRNLSENLVFVWIEWKVVKIMANYRNFDRNYLMEFL